MRHGGMGLHHLSPAEGCAAFLSSPMLPRRALRHNFLPSTGPPGRASVRSGKRCATMWASRIPAGRSLTVCVFATCCHKPRKTRHAPPQPAACAIWAAPPSGNSARHFFCFPWLGEPGPFNRSRFISGEIYHDRLRYYNFSRYMCNEEMRWSTLCVTKGSPPR